MYITMPHPGIHYCCLLACLLHITLQGVVARCGATIPGSGKGEGCVCGWGKENEERRLRRRKSAGVEALFSLSLNQRTFLPSSRPLLCAHVGVVKIDSADEPRFGHLLIGLLRLAPLEEPGITGRGAAGRSGLRAGGMLEVPLGIRYVRG